jgi:anti-sigma regulatory factor (Ser/Thr protein kinase)
MAQEWDSADTFAIELDDEGIPFDPLSVKAPDINRPIEEREADGLGVFLMRKMTDEARYVREGNRNRLTLIINKASAE